MYGCKDKENAKNLNPRIFPLLFHKQSKYFSFKDCRFNMQKSKEATARIQIHKEIRKNEVYTLETSFSGYLLDKDDPNYMIQHSEKDLLNIGADLVKAIYSYHRQFTKKDISDSELEKQGLVNINEVVHELHNNDALVNYGDQSDGVSSDSCPSEDNLDANILAKIVPKNNNLTKKLAERKKRIKQKEKEKKRA